VTIIDRNDYFNFVCTAPRAITTDGHFDATTLNYSHFIEKHNHKAVFKQGTLDSINHTKNTISIKTKGGQDSEEVHYDYLALCTGSTYKNPIKDVDADTYEVRKNGLDADKNTINGAQSVLVVGAGAVGVEMIGELTDLNAKILAKNDPSNKVKKIGLIYGGAQVLPGFP
jgi:NADH dehydrogenase FAD-containing subunit